MGDGRQFWESLLAAPSSGGLLKLHGEIRKAMTDTRGDRARSLMRGALRVAERAHSFMLMMETERSVKSHAEKASYLDLASIGGIALQDLSGHESNRSLSKLLLAGVSEGLAYLATREFVKAGQAEIDGILATHSFVVQEELWSLVEDAGVEVGGADAEKFRDAVGTLAASLADPRRPAEKRSALVVSLYSMLIRARLQSALPGRAGIRS